MVQFCLLVSLSIVYMKLTLKKDRMKISELVDKPRKVLGIYRRDKDLSVGDKTRLLIYSSS